MRYLRAWVFGSIATAILVGVAVATLSAVAASGAVSDLRVALWGVVLVDVRVVADTTETTIGPGLPLLAAAAGLVNAVALGLIVRRGRDRDPIA